MAEIKNNTTHDDLDIEEIDQLHNAVLQMSKSCFEYKKICVSLLGAAIALIVKFSEENVGITLFIVSLFIVISFWLADATAYFYQTATRIRMNKIRKEIAERNTIENYEVKTLKLSKFKALFNGSMILYFSISLFIIFGGLVFLLKGTSV